MAYKSRLQTNNIDLSAILADINNLPPAGTEDISAELNALSDAVDAHLKMVNRKVAENNGEGEYVWKKLTAEGGDFIDFVVSSDANAYPDGREQDGYWYELAEEGVAGIDFGKVTLTAAATNITVQHNLKVTPSQAILIELGDLTSSTSRTRFAIDNGKSELVQSSVGGNPSNTMNEIVLTSTEISFDSYSFTYKYVAGTYLWVAIA